MRLCYRRCFIFEVVREFWLSFKSFLDKNFFGPDTENPCFVAASPAMKDLSGIIKNLSVSSSPVLIQGERGSGKTLYAFQIFLNSETSSGFYIVNPDNFDLEKAVKLSGSTLFFRHIEEFSSELQSEIYEFLKLNVQNKLGIKTIFSSVSLLDSLVESNQFSRELFMRLNSFPIRIKPLRERKEDIASLSEMYLSLYKKKWGKKELQFSKKSEEFLLNYTWPGNVSELRTVIERAVILEEEEVLSSKNLFVSGSAKAENSFAGNSLEESVNTVVSAEEKEDLSLKTGLNSFKRKYIKMILEQNDWNQTKASKVLDIQRTYLTRLIGELDIRR